MQPRMFVQKIKHLNAKFDIISKSAILLISEEGVNNYAPLHARQIRAEDFKRLLGELIKIKVIIWSGEKFLQNYTNSLILQSY